MLGDESIYYYCIAICSKAIKTIQKIYTSALMRFFFFWMVLVFEINITFYNYITIYVYINTLYRFIRSDDSCISKSYSSLIITDDETVILFDQNIIDFSHVLHYLYNYGPKIIASFIINVRPWQYILIWCKAYLHKKNNIIIYYNGVE